MGAGIGIDFIWKVCPEGAQIVDYGQPDSGDPNVTVLTGRMTGRWLRNRTKNLRGYRLHLTDLRNGTMLDHFMSADGDRALEDFASRFGIISSRDYDVQEVPMDGVISFQRAFREFFEFQRSGKTVEAVEIFNRISDASAGTNLIPLLRFERGPQAAAMSFQPRTPYGYMLMEASMAISNATVLRTCLNCGRAFFAGAMTSKRTNAYYCSNRCRVAAQRAAARA